MTRASAFHELLGASSQRHVSTTVHHCAGKRTVRVSWRHRDNVRGGTRHHMECSRIQDPSMTSATGPVAQRGNVNRSASAEDAWT